MRKKRDRLAWLLIAAVVLGSCTSAPSGTQEAGNPAPTTGAAAADEGLPDRSHGGDLDDQMCLVERRFPGFAGVMYDKGLVLFFAKEPPTNLREVQDAIEELTELDAPGRARVERVRYGACQLLEWYRPLTEAVFDLDGVVMTDIDEAANALFIGMIDADRYRDAVLSRAKELGIPPDVVHVEETAPVEFD